METKLVHTMQSFMLLDSVKLSSKPSGSMNCGFSLKEKTVQMPVRGHSRYKLTSACNGKVGLEVSCSFNKFSDSVKLSSKPSGSMNCGFSLKEKTVQMPVRGHSRYKLTSACNGKVGLEVSCSFNKFSGSTLESGSAYTSFDEGLILKNKRQHVIPYLNGRCIYLVGMMGSGKTTVGKILSEVLGYSFFDSDKIVEQAVGGIPVSEIFKLYGEGFFREKETEALQNLSLVHRVVASTGGGAVVRPINWRYMQKGISVWLDVPLEALAQRVAAVGIHSRPLLHHESGDAYTKAFMRLSTLLGERGDAYATADTRVSLENIAAKLGHRDVSNLTPTIIAIEALEQIEGYLKDEAGTAIEEFQC